MDCMTCMQIQQSEQTHNKPINTHTIKNSKDEHYTDNCVNFTLNSDAFYLHTHTHPPFKSKFRAHQTIS